ncbi:MAG: ABC transporter ATP-binding protein [Clostridia bacterium]|nr:ABC transporter ATP-binding protein [Clostridia bacterium]
MITFSGVTKRYGKTTVFTDFNLEIEDGKICCVLGESGVGKTTLLNMLSRITPYEGEISEAKCSYIFQEPRLVPNLTVRGNMSLVCRDTEMVDTMLERVGLSAKKDVYPVTLSGGEARRVDFARAFVYDSDVVLMDEPFTSLDLKLKYEMMNLFSELQKASGRTAVFVTHDIDECVTLSHRAVVLKAGKIVSDFAISGEPIREYGAVADERQKIHDVLMV